MEKPYWYTTPSIRTMFLITLIVLCPQLFMLALIKSYQALSVVAAAFLASLLAEALNRFLRGASFNGLTAAVQGIITGMFFPAGYPLWTVFALTLCTLLIAKYAFGGVAASWVNSAALTVAVAYFIGQKWFPGFLLTKAQFAAENPSVALMSHIPPLSMEAAIIDFANSSVFSFTRTIIPNGFATLFWDSGSPITAFRFNTLTLLASVVLIALDAVNWILPLCYIGTYCALVRLFAPLFVGGRLGHGDIFLALLTGGTLFTAFFMIHWPGTVPLTKRGKICYSCIVGCLAFVFSGGGTSPTGAVFTVLAANLVSAFIQFAEGQERCQKFDGKLVPQIVEHWKRAQAYRQAAQGESAGMGDRQQ
jgi:electron transport complex protein RnfD